MVTWKTTWRFHAFEEGNFKAYLQLLKKSQFHLEIVQQRYVLQNWLQINTPYCYDPWYTSVILLKIERSSCYCWLFYPLLMKKNWVLENLSQIQAYFCVTWVKIVKYFWSREVMTHMFRFYPSKYHKDYFRFSSRVATIAIYSNDSLKRKIFSLSCLSVCLSVWLSVNELALVLAYFFEKLH